MFSMEKRYSIILDSPFSEILSSLEVSRLYKEGYSKWYWNQNHGRNITPVNLESLKENLKNLNLNSNALSIENIQPNCFSNIKSLKLD